MQTYAHSYPDEVTGLVLLDPAPLGWIIGEGFPELRDLFNQEKIAMGEAADDASASSDPEIATSAAYLNAVASENKQLFGQTAGQVAGIPTFGEIPLTVIGATEAEPRFGEYAQAFRQFWNDESQRLADKSSEGRFILAKGSSHHIHLDAPQVVVEAILQLAQ